MTTATTLALPFGLPAFAPGTVWLAGAGPGDPGLLSLLAAHALGQADAIVYDALVDERVLALAAPGADLHYMGKRGGAPSPKQAEITGRLIELARAGRRVLRLKGGDPFVFGRGAEEALALAEAGVPFRIVPGVTAGVGGLAYAGIPTTARDTNSAVTFITGHAADGALPAGLDWDALAKGSPVLVFYMALRHLPQIVERLIAAGRAPDTPAAAVANATTPAQSVVTAPLAGLPAALAAAGMRPPAIVVVGEVVDLRAVIAAGMVAGHGD
ncbi:uroporphyrinogen-III C-methyltransferase [Novispirillum sp. DQ9]|uniref:uroporphyrinogen-III C-methyltransferase n=1 Tax=Novispirillum sp. DQ9 TaxID=3398612 RepID=UPI003C7B4DB0